MIKAILITFCAFTLTVNGLHGQSKKYIATAIMKSSIVEYVHAIDSSIVLIDFMKVKKNKRKENFEKVSGLILSGGRDVHPSTYGRKDSLNICVTHKKRDEVELYMIGQALQDSIPILGICRGHQILNASLNGDLYQDIPTEYKGNKLVTHRDPAEQEYVFHPIKLVESSELLRLYGNGQFEVNSFHHQGVKVRGNGMRIVAHAPDGLNEASEWAKGLEDRWIVGVQWHPEKLYQKEPAHLNIMRDFLLHLQP
jgi:putative glutamine amidotransferase